MDRQSVSRFREELTADVPLHPLEQTLVILAGLQLCFMPWALGSMHPWSQFIAFGLALSALVVSLIPRNYTEEYSRKGDYRMSMWRRLLRFPIFWIGLLLFAYITLQGLNPSWGAVVYPNGGFVIGPIHEHISWLPTGVVAPFMKMNEWRMLIIYGGAWMLACALWVGLSRRQSVQRLLTIIVLNAAAIGLVAFLERATGTRDVLWMVKGKAHFFVGSFIYKNHAGAFFNLTLTCALAMALWHYRRAIRRMKRNSPAPFYGLCAFVILVVEIICYSRMATILMLVYLVVVSLGLVIAWLRTPREERHLGGGLWLVGIFVIAAVAGGSVLRFDTALDRMEQIVKAVHTDGVTNITDREIATQATLDMARDKLITGWGSGSFRWIFREYQENYPEIWWNDQRVPRRFDTTRFWLDAHNDYAQLLAEVGIIGCTLVLGLLASGFILIIRGGGLKSPHILLMVGGLIMVLLHCWVDSHSTNPAILCTFSAVLVLSARWSQLETHR